MQKEKCKKTFMRKGKTKHQRKARKKNKINLKKRTKRHQTSKR